MRQTIDRLRGHLEALNALRDEPFDVLFSAGWAEFGKEGQTSADAVLGRRRPPHVRHQIRPRAHAARPQSDEKARERKNRPDKLKIGGDFRFLRRICRQGVFADL